MAPSAEIWGFSSGSSVDVYGGSIYAQIQVYDGGTINMMGGQLYTAITYPDAVINFSGGVISQLQTRVESTSECGGSGQPSCSMASLNVYGIDFQIDGNAIPGLESVGDSVQIDLPDSSHLTGLLADGTPVVLSERFGDRIRPGTLTLFRTEAPQPLPAIDYVVDSADSPSFLGDNQSLTLLPGGLLRSRFMAGPGSRLTMKGGFISFNVSSVGADIVIEEGVIGPNFVAHVGTQLKILGGEFYEGLNLREGSRTKVFGGALNEGVIIEEGAFIDIYGRNFLLDRLEIPRFADDVGSTILLEYQSNALLSATLADGSLLRWTLTHIGGDIRNPFRTSISPNAIIRLHIIPEPSSVLLASFARVYWLGVSARATRQKSNP